MTLGRQAKKKHKREAIHKDTRSGSDSRSESRSLNASAEQERTWHTSPSTSYQSQVPSRPISELEETVRSGEWVPDSTSGLPRQLKSSKSRGSKRLRDVGSHGTTKRKASEPEKWRRRGAQVCLWCCCCWRVPPQRLGWMIAFSEMALAVCGLLESAYFIWTTPGNQAKYSFYVEMCIVVLWLLSSVLFIIALVEHRQRLLLPHMFISVGFAFFHEI